MIPRHPMPAAELRKWASENPDSVPGTKWAWWDAHWAASAYTASNVDNLLSAACDGDTWVYTGPPDAFAAKPATERTITVDRFAVVNAHGYVLMHDRESIARCVVSSWASESVDAHVVRVSLTLPLPPEMPTVAVRGEVAGG